MCSNASLLLLAPDRHRILTILMLAPADGFAGCSPPPRLYTGHSVFKILDMSVMSFGSGVTSSVPQASTANALTAAGGEAFMNSFNSKIVSGVPLSRTMAPLLIRLFLIRLTAETFENGSLKIR